MNTRKSTQPTCDKFCKTPSYRNKFRGLLLFVAALFSAEMMANAANILVNPGFESARSSAPGRLRALKVGVRMPPLRTEALFALGRMHFGRRVCISMVVLLLTTTWGLTS